MAWVSQSNISPVPPTSPPPIYSRVPIRTISPQVDRSDMKDTANPLPEPAARPHMRKTISMVSDDPSDGVTVQQSPSAAVMVHPPTGRPFMDTPSVSIQEQTANPAVRPPSGYNREETMALPELPKDDPTRLSPSPRIMPIRHVLQESNRSEFAHRRVISDAPLTYQVPKAYQRPVRHVSASDIDHNEHAENYQPLQYHHQTFANKDLTALNKRASKLTIGTTNSDGSASSDPYGQLRLPSALPNNVYGRALQRPDSGFSSTSDLRGRDLSPAPNAQARATSAHSRSPDMRPLSYVDLLNVPYPQPPPSGAQNLHNSQLRSAVGSNASLLSTRKTLDMYRANAKKTTDLATQYQFAIFMVSAAQEAILDEDLSQSGMSEKSLGSIQGDLLKEARTILQRLSDRSYPFAQYYLADGYASGLFNKGKEDHEKAFPLFLAASKHGHAEAGYRTALSYEFGWGVRVDAAKAVQFYQHAASKNHPGAILRLGKACLMGDMGLGKRYREGIRWLKRGTESADFQYNSAPFELGMLHEQGYGPDIFKDESYAAQLFTKAADLGHVESNYRLGEAYEHGKLNCPRDAALSVHFYTGAAQHGHPDAQMALCAWYMVGAQPVLEKDENEAYEWARRAAESGMPKAEYTVGYFTEMGIGCRRDILEANVWYVRAADQGDERAKHRIAAIRAAATGSDPMTVASGKMASGKAVSRKKSKGNLTQSESGGNIGAPVEKSKKKFGIF